MANIITGDQNDNWLYGSFDDDILRGLGGNDVLMGNQGNDILEGGTGNDILHGMQGNNTYLFGRGDGQDIIMSPDDSISKHNMIRFGEGIAPSDIVIERFNDNLVLRIAGTTDSITIDNYFARGWGPDRAAHPLAIEEIRFFDGASWDRSTILTKLIPLIELDNGDNFFGGGSVDGKGGNDQLFGSWSDDVMRGGDGNDIINSMDGDDILVGGAGDDILSGGSGANTYQFAAGWGHDTVAMSNMGGIPNATIIEVANALPGTLQLSRSGNGQGNDLIIAAKDGTDTITVTGYFDMAQDALARTVRIAFADHSVWTYDRIQQATMMMPPGMDLTGTDGADWLNGAYGIDRIDGGKGDDNIDGMWGNDVLLGGDGNDQVRGSEGDDLLAGGAGDDVLDGGYGNDVLLGGAGFDTLRGGDGDDILDAGAGNAFLDGGMGNNLFRIGRDAGDVRIMPTPMPNNGNTIVFGADVRPQDIVITPEGSWQMVIAIRGTDVRITTHVMVGLPDGAGGQSTQTFLQLKFADGTVWENDALLRQMYTGDDNDNFITGSRDGDTMDGRGGNDNLQGGEGNDKLLGGSGNDILQGDMGDDTLMGQDGNDLLIGGNGNDILQGGAGNDFIDAGNGANIIRFGLHDGIDTVIPSWDRGMTQNTIEFGAGIVQDAVLARIDANSGDLTLTLAGGLDQLIVKNYRMEGQPDALDQVRFADGSSWSRDDIARLALTGDDNPNFLTGGAGNDVLDGKGGDDVLQGKDGNDTLLGGAGNDWMDGGRGNNTFIGGSGNDLMLADFGADTYIFNRGNGIDTIDDRTWGGPESANVIRFGAGIAATDLQFELSGDTLRIHYGAGDEIVLHQFNVNGPDDYLPVNRFEFADNSVYTYRQLSNHAPELMVVVPDLSVAEGQALAYTIPAYTFFDRDPGDVLTLELGLMMGGPLPAWLSFDPLTGKISGTPGYGDSGELWLKVTARDKQGAISNDNFHLNVLNVDPGPVLHQQIAAQFATEARQFSLVIPTSIFVDPDGGALTYKLALAGDAPLPSWLHFDAASMTLSGTPGDADTGTLQLRLTAIDSGGQVAFTEYALNVANINQAPVLVQAPASMSVEDGVLFSYALPATMFSDADAGDSGVLSVAGLPAGFSFNAQTRTISGTATLAEVGAHALTVSYTDSGALSASAGFALTVTAAASVTLTGTSAANVLTGKSNSDVLRGLGGDDVLNGGIGADRMEGGTGNDTFYVDNAGDLVVENLAEGTDTVMSAISYTLGANVERLTLTGNGALGATGNTLNNILTGNSGANLLDGGVGGDSMAGGAGHDTYMVDNTSDTVTEALDAGFDTVISSVGRTLGANQEALTLTGTAAINGAGNALNNLIQGNGAINTLSGGDGADILQGGAGDDILSDTSVMGNLFDGGAGADRLTGGAGADLFIGGAGNDTITTSSGADVIAFNRGGGQDSVAVATGTDNTVSLGHGILYSDLALLKTGNDLILKTGMGEQISFKGWYSSTNAHSVGTLQVVTEGGADYVAGSASAIHDNKVEQFNFTALVTKFDQARVGQSASFNWSMGASLEQFSNGGSDSAAVGGDLAYQYALHDSLAALSAMPALQIIGSASFGTAGQALQSAGALNDGIAVLY